MSFDITSYRLNANSPAIDKGKLNQLIKELELDFVGTQRETSPDIGAFEFN